MNIFKFVLCHEQSDLAPNLISRHTFVLKYTTISTYADTVILIFNMHGNVCYVKKANEKKLD